MVHSEFLQHRNTEHVTEPLSFEDRNVVVGLMRVATQLDGVKEYQRLKEHVDAYTIATHPDTHLFVARSALMQFELSGASPDIVGFAAGRFKHTDSGMGMHVEGLYVSPLEHGRGHGKGLARSVIELAATQGAAYVQLDQPYTNIAARKLFQSLDFMSVDQQPPRLTL